MASRRDELNAYTFARKRTVGAFLQPSGGGNDEDAPKPVRAVLPSIVVAAVLVAGFGMWGVIKPAAPKGWDDGKNIIQGKDSTTRYVVLIDPKTHTKMLHQVLNMSSAKLVLPAGSKVVPVADSVLDAYPNHGPTIGIPYAPDKLPTADDASAAKKWTVCDRPGKDNLPSTISQSVFVMAGAEAKTLNNPDQMLGPGQWLFVQGPEEDNNQDPSDPKHPEKKEPAKRSPLYLIDPQGTQHSIGDTKTPQPQRELLVAALFGSDAKPQPVTEEWLKTTNQAGAVIKFPDIPNLGSSSNVQLTGKGQKTVGQLLKYDNSLYVLGKNSLYAVSPFQAALLINDSDVTNQAYGGNSPTFGTMSPTDYANLKDKVDSNALALAKDMPQEQPSKPVNVIAGTAKDRTVVCSTFESIDGGNIKRSVWAGVSYPAQISTDSAPAHVTAGHGLYFRAIGTGKDDSGSTFLITGTGLRYSVQNNGDGGKGPAATPDPAQQGDKAQNDGAPARLGYDKIQPVSVPVDWANLVPFGPVLNTNAALQAQNA